MIVGLRVDVDTYRGTRYGVPALLETLARHGVTASFFFSVGPDNMGRHLWRLLRPAFLWKMLRTRAASLYGWDILLRGTFWPGPLIGERCADVIRATEAAGHEVGLHAWDHHAWQAHIDAMDQQDIESVVSRGVDALERILGHAPRCTAAPGWRCNDRVLLAKTGFDFDYNSDCRGETVFAPVVGGRTIEQMQVPVTLPTYDEAVGCDGVTDANYNDHLLSLIDPDRLNVLTIHAEVEGLVCATMFDDFLHKANQRGIRFAPLKDAVTHEHAAATGRIVERQQPGREGFVAVQEQLQTSGVQPTG